MPVWSSSQRQKCMRTGELGIQILEKSEWRVKKITQAGRLKHLKQLTSFTQRLKSMADPVKSTPQLGSLTDKESEGKLSKDCFFTWFSSETRSNFSISTGHGISGESVAFLKEKIVLLSLVTADAQGNTEHWQFGKLQKSFSIWQLISVKVSYEKMLGRVMRFCESEIKASL